LGYELESTIFAILRRLLGYAEAAFYAPEHSGDIKHSLADIRLAKQHLGYKPSVDFEEGLNRAVEWYRSQIPISVMA
jgi:UDP-N-acetylglucosamine 4-epimerase